MLRNPTQFQNALVISCEKNARETGSTLLFQPEAEKKLEEILAEVISRAKQIEQNQLLPQALVVPSSSDNQPWPSILKRS